MKRKLLLPIATIFYYLFKFISNFDKTPYFMHTGLKYKIIRKLKTLFINLEHKTLNLI